MQQLGSEPKGLGGSTDDAPIKAAAADFGQIIHRRPIAVLKPAVPNDITKIVELANRRSIKVAMSGPGHSMFGQCQADGGVIIDFSSSYVDGSNWLRGRRTQSVQINVFL